MINGSIVAVTFPLVMLEGLVNVVASTMAIIKSKYKPSAQVVGKLSLPVSWTGKKLYSATAPQVPPLIIILKLHTGGVNNPIVASE